MYIFNENQTVIEDLGVKVHFIESALGKGLSPAGASASGAEHYLRLKSSEPSDN